jgi:hypothetical protein
MAGATQERKLLGVGSTARLGPVRIEDDLHPNGDIAP